MKTTKESKYAHSLDRCEVESVVNPLKDKEPTPAWYEKLMQVLKHYDISFRQLCVMAADGKRCNLIGNPYGILSLRNAINNFVWRKGAQTWTKNAQYTVNDHLDILIDYLSKPENNAEPSAMEPLQGETWEQYVERVHPGTTLPKAQEQEAPALTLKERLEKERAEGKWPSVDEKMALNKPKAEPIAKVDEVADIPGGFKLRGQLLKPIDKANPGYSGLGKSNGVKAKLRKVRKHNKRKITINIYI